jgi:MtN3 and saliva related transmembrane protein
MISWDIVGHMAGLFVAVALLPQVIKTWRTKSTGDISLLWTIVLIIGLILWVIYGFAYRLLPIIIFVSIEIFLASIILVFKLIYK